MGVNRRTRTEDYLAAIDHICREQRSDRAGTGAIAAVVGVAKGTASSVLKSLAEQGLIDLLPYAGSKLTTTGEQRARRIVRRYRLLEMFLMRTLDMDGERSADDAWSLEPGASDALVEQIDQFLRHPEFNPSGVPIPSADGLLPA